MKVKNKKICILTSVHSVFDIRIFHKEAKTLNKVGYNVSLIVQHNKNEIIDEVKIIALSKPKSRFFRIFGTTWKIFKLALKQKADIYHFHDPELIPVGNLLKIFSKAKIIYDVHEDYPKTILNKYWMPKIVRKPISVLFNCFEKLFSQKFDYIIAATPNIKKKFKKHKVIDITNYPILEYFEKITDNTKQKTDKKEIKLIYAGGLSKIRGIEEIIKSLIYIKNKRIKLILAGKFENKEFEKKIKKMSEWKKVEFKGWLLQKDVYQNIKNAYIGFVCFLSAPNHLNSSPNKMFEYMATGIPVIASNFPSWKKIIEENQCGICVNPLKPKKIAEAVKYLIENPCEAKKMGENGRKAVLEKYNWKSESKKLLKIYEELIGQ